MAGLDSHQPPLSPDVSLAQLSQAFAEMLRSGESTEDFPVHSAPPAAAESRDSEVDDDVYCPVNPRSILEAMLFVGRPDNAPLTGEESAAVMRGVRADEIDDLVSELNEKYQAGGCAYQIVSEGPGYRLVLRDECDALKEKFSGRMREVRLSQAAVDVLSIVAYHPGVTADEVTTLRGRPSGSILTQLVRRQLLRIDRPEGKVRRLHYHTTERFLELFGLAALDELPRQEETE